MQLGDLPVKRATTSRQCKEYNSGARYYVTMGQGEFYVRHPGALIQSLTPKQKKLVRIYKIDGSRCKRPRRRWR